MELTDQAIPCGLIAKSIFTDKFNLMEDVDGGQNEPIQITRTNIAWSSDIEYSYKNILDQGDWKDIQWHDMTDGK